MMPEREEEEKEETQKAKEEKHPSLDHEAQKHHNKNVTVILDLEQSTSTSSSKTSSSSPSNGESSFPFTPQEQKRIIRQIDLRVVLLLGAMYAVSLIDRSQIGLAMISGMGTDLQLTVGARYNIINAVFFGPYVLFQLPSTVLLRKIGPKRFLSGATLAWGLATLACGFVREWRDLVALRVVLGACEAGFYPASIYLLSTWYTRYELQKRFAGLLILGVIPAAFSGILAFGISHLEGRGIAGGGPSWWGRSLKQKNPLDATSSSSDDDGDHLSYGPGLAGWRWIFILYGITTCVIAGVAWFLLVDFPEKIAFGGGNSGGSHNDDDGDGDGKNEKKRSSRWWWKMKNKNRVAFLTKQEAAWAVHRIEKDRNDVMPGEFHLSSYLSPILSLQVWSFALLYCLSGTIGYGINFALPLILHKGMGLSTPVSQCLVTPPYLAAAGVTWIEAYYADQWRVRSPFILGNCVAVGVGLCLIGFVENVGVRYFGVFLAAIPSTANGPCILTWQANNVRGQWKRALVSALSVGLGAIGGVTGSMVFRTQDQPHYTPGIATCITAAGLIMVIVVLLNITFMRANKRAAAGGEPVEGLVGFRYTL